MLPGEEAFRRFGLRIVVIDFAFQSHQTGDLVLTPLRNACAAPLPLRSRLVTTAIDFDRHYAWHVGNLHGQSAFAVSTGLLVTLDNQLGSDGLGQSSGVPSTDR